MSRVQVVNVTHVPLPPSPTRLPEQVELSLFDAVWIGLPPIQRLLLFHGSHIPPLPALLLSLRSALSRTLLHYFTLAGTLTYLPASGDVVIDCSPAAVGPGVAFLEAEADGDLGRLTNDEAHNVGAFLRLVPELDVGELPAPVFAVQATVFRGPEGVEGVAVGFSAHHVVADGRAIWRFVESWAAECRGAAGPPPPTVDRAVIKHPRGEEIARTFLHHMSPSLPTTEAPILPIQNRLQLNRRTFMISPESIQLLKQRGMQCINTQAMVQSPSTFISISAHAWISFIRSKGFQRDDDTYIVILADCRARLDPPVDEGYFGNCIKACYAKAMVGDLLEEDGHARACMAIQKVIRESLEDPLSGCDTWMNLFKEVNLSRLVNTAASPRFMVYETDFGWGRPSRVELVSMNHDGELVFSGASDGSGVQLSVALDPLHMKLFAEHFVGGITGCATGKLESNK